MSEVALDLEKLTCLNDRKCLDGVQVEQDLKFARFLAGLHGSKARKEVGDLMNAVVETGAALPLTEDKLMTLMEAAQVRASCLSEPLRAVHCPAA